MRIVNLLAIMLLAAFILTVPAFAGSRRYAEDQMDSWIDSVYDLGYDIYYSDVDMIDEDHSVSYYFDLEPGWYYFVAEGGEDTEDIDMYVYDDQGRELASDTYSDNYPICEFEVDDYMEVEVEIVAYSFFGRAYEDYFCLVGGYSYYDDYDYYEDDYYEDDYYDDYYIEDIMDYWTDWAYDSGYDVLYTDVSYLEDDDSMYYNMELDEGIYYVYAESLFEYDDIDMYVWDEDHNELSSDTFDDNFPICEFELRRPEYVEIEVMPYTYEHGYNTDFCLILATEDGEILSGDYTHPSDHTTPYNVDDYEEYMDELMDEYMEMVIDYRYEMIYDQVELIDWDDYDTVTITLGRGDYVVYAEGGLRIDDLDLYVYDEDGYIIAEDTLTNNYPVCEFSTRESATFEIEISPYEMSGSHDEGYYLLIVVRD